MLQQNNFLTVFFLFSPLIFEPFIDSCLVFDCISQIILQQIWFSLTQSKYTFLCIFFNCNNNTRHTKATKDFNPPFFFIIFLLNLHRRFQLFFHGNITSFKFYDFIFDWIEVIYKCWLVREWFLREHKKYDFACL